jgi:alkylation response protein AidB-like acyl-CoA dehydrogenase
VQGGAQEEQAEDLCFPSGGRSNSRAELEQMADKYADLEQKIREPLIAEHRAAFDAERRLPNAVFNALADAGLFRLLLPELLPVEYMRVVEAASVLDGSVGWLVTNGSAMSRVAGYVSEPVAREWFADPRGFMVSATGAVGEAQKVEGGYRVMGRWPFGSGARHATHFMALASVKRADGRDEPPLCFYFARGDVAVHDTWRIRLTRHRQVRLRSP